MRTREEKLSLKRAREKKYRLQLTETQRAERNEKARLRAAQWRKSPQYQDWLEKSREKRKQLKEKYRRQQGCEPQQLRSARKAEKELQRRLEMQSKEEARIALEAAFVGPRIPEEHRARIEYAARYSADEAFRAKERARTVRRKKALPDWYVKHLLGMKNAPESLVKLKRIHKQVDDLLGDIDANH